MAHSTRYFHFYLLIQRKSLLLNEISGLFFKYTNFSYSTSQKLTIFFYSKHYNTRHTRQYKITLHMIHYSTQFCCTYLTSYCHSSYTFFVLETSILPPPSSKFFQNIPTSLSLYSSNSCPHGSKC